MQKDDQVEKLQNLVNADKEKNQENVQRLKMNRKNYSNKWKFINDMRVSIPKDPSLAPAPVQSHMRQSQQK